MFIMRVYEYKLVYDKGINYANWKKRKKPHFFLCIYRRLCARVHGNLQREL